MIAVERVSHVRTTVGAKLRPLGVLGSLGCVAGALYVYRTLGYVDQKTWWLLAAALALSLLWQRGIALTGSAVESGPQAASRERLFVGNFLTLCGAGLWVWAGYALNHDWLRNFDSVWIAWLLAAVILSIGLDLAWGRWPQPRRPARSWPIRLLVVALVGAAAVYRFGSLALFNGATHVTQVEELQVGMFGAIYLQGGRLRWEYLSQAWLAALGIWSGGPTLLGMRIPFVVVSVLKTGPLFVWLRFAVGTVGATVATALFAVSFWDVMLSRIPTNQNALIIAIAFALLAGPARRGRPSAYVWLGLLGGYVAYEYVGYRPLAVLVLLGAAVLSVRDVASSWGRRIARPLITALLVTGMVLPLFLTLHSRGRLYSDYFNGWIRARDQGPYYDPNDSWQATINKRVERSARVASLFFFVGDPNITHNVDGRPLVDPATATLLLIGIGYGIVHAARGVFGLTLLGLAASLAGTLVATGNWDVGRASVAVAYVYGLVGYGAASVFAAFEGTWRRVGRVAAAVLLTAGVLAGAYFNTKTLVDFLWSPLVHQAEFSPLAYLATWLHQHVRDGERVVGISPGNWNVLQPNDGAWLRGGDIPGAMSLNVENALQDWVRNPKPTLLVVDSGTDTPAVKEYLEWLLPGLEMQLEPQVDGGGGDIAFAHLAGPPPDLATRVATLHCRGVQGEYELLGSSGNEVLARVVSVAPFIDRNTWPVAIRVAAFRSEGRGKQIRGKFRTNFSVRQAGDYAFFIETYAATLALQVDGTALNGTGKPMVYLETGTHRLQVDATFDALVDTAMVRLLWHGLDSRNLTELMPLYRIGEEDPQCSPAALAETPTAEDEPH